VAQVHAVKRPDGVGSLDRPAGRSGGSGPLALFALGLVAAAALAWTLGLHDWVRPGRLARLRTAIEGYGAWGPALFVAGYVAAELLFVPALPLTLLGGLAFGPAWGIVYVWIAATLAASLAFLVARYLARDTVERWMERSPRLARIDAAVERHGWRILVVTRLVPVFPFNLQNFVYGLTRIPFWTYVGLSSVCILPGTVAFTLAGGALSGGGSPARTGWTLGAAAVLVVLVSLTPRWLTRRSRVAAALLAPDEKTPAS
jgi:uncharacterized membrane protein YdjX (TVP38/TMEM64 family)